MKRFTTLVGSILLAGGLTAAQAELKIDFNNAGAQDNGPHLELGYQAYTAENEIAVDFVPQAYPTTFAGTPTVTVTPAWPNTTDNRVQQMIDRTDQDAAGNVLGSWDANWQGTKINLITDFIGIDSRTANGGNGYWDGTGATAPTYMTLTLSGLPAGSYDWLSYHHDTEKVWSDFMVDLSLDGGATFGATTSLEITSSGAGANPANTTGLFIGDTDPDPANLPSTFTTSFMTDGVNDVVVRFAPFSDGGAADAVHKAFFGINGFELTQAAAIPEPSTLAFGALFLGMVALARKMRG